MSSETPAFIYHFSLAAPWGPLEAVVAFYQDIMGLGLGLGLGLGPGARPDFQIPGDWLYSGVQI